MFFNSKSFLTLSYRAFLVSLMRLKYELALKSPGADFTLFVVNFQVKDCSQWSFMNLVPNLCCKWWASWHKCESGKEAKNTNSSFLINALSLAFLRRNVKGNVMQMIFRSFVLLLLLFKGFWWKLELIKSNS